MSKIRVVPFKYPLTPKFKTPLLKPNNQTSLSISSPASTASGCNGLQARFKLYTFVEPPDIKIQKTSSLGKLSDHEIHMKATGVSTSTIRFRPKKSFKCRLISTLKNNAPGIRKRKDKTMRILDEIFPSPQKAKQSNRNVAYEVVKQDVLKTIYKMKQELEEIRERRQRLFIDSRINPGMIAKDQKSQSLKYTKSSGNLSLAADKKAIDAYQGGNAGENEIFEFFEE